MTIHTPYIMQPAVADPDITYTAQELRMYQQASATLAGQGVYKVNDFKVTQRGAGANFSVDVAAGTAGVLGDDITNQGLYLAWSDAVVNVVTPGAPGSGTRVHRLVLQVRDKLSNGAFTTYDAILSLLQDTGSGTPAEPNSAVTLALISISVGQVSVTNANITDSRLPWNDVWHSLGTLAGASIGVARYKLFLTIGMVGVQVDVTFGGSTAAPINFSNTLPAAYQPLAGDVDVRAAMAQTNGAGALARIFVGQVGGSSPGTVTFASLASANVIGTYSASFFYTIV